MTKILIVDYEGQMVHSLELKLKYEDGILNVISSNRNSDFLDDFSFK